MKLLYYISGHGYGHARRSAEIIKALVRLRPDAEVIARTSAPAYIFRGIPRTTLSLPPLPLDAGAVEKDVLTIDARATLDQLRRVLAEKKTIIETESAFARANAVHLIASDIPFFAGDIASEIGVESVGISNFTWDWIYEPFVEKPEDRRALIDPIRSSYGKMSRLLRLPFGHPQEAFREVKEAPLVAQRSTRSREEILHDLPEKARQFPLRIVIASRGETDAALIRKVAQAMPDGALFFPSPLPPQLPANVFPIVNGTATSFVDLLQVSDVVVAKLGYGIVSDCIAAGIRLLYPPRMGFREDEVTERQAARFLCMEKMQLDDFKRGEWMPYIRSLLSIQPQLKRMPDDGAAACALCLGAAL